MVSTKYIIFIVFASTDSFTFIQFELTTGCNYIVCDQILCGEVFVIQKKSCKCEQKKTWLAKNIPMYSGHVGQRKLKLE